MIEDVTASNLTEEGGNILEENTLKYTCNDCMFVTTSKTSIDEHVIVNHSPDKNEEVRFVCIICEHEFSLAEDYDSHVNTHETAPEQDDVMKELKNIVFNLILENPIQEIEMISDNMNEERERAEQFECTKLRLKLA